jgi:hypothetical protein
MFKTNSSSYISILNPFWVRLFSRPKKRPKRLYST